MKKSLMIILLLLLIPIVSGCGNSKEVHEHCTRSATAGEDVDVNLSYELYYEGDVLNRLESTEQIVSKNKESLDTYENAYKDIHKNYNGLKYFETSVERKDDSVTSKMIIKYDKIDIDKLIEIEGEEDNIFENKVPKVTKWKELAKKLGTKCEVVTE